MSNLFYYHSDKHETLLHHTPENQSAIDFIKTADFNENNNGIKVS